MDRRRSKRKTGKRNASQQLTEVELLDALRDNFLDGFREGVKYVKLHLKGDWLDNDDDLLWHFTRLSVLKRMLAGRQLWLSDLAFSNDANEIAYGLSRAIGTIERATAHWDHRVHAETVRRIAERAVRRWERYHVYAFCLSEHRDTAQHWNMYGGGLNIQPTADDPHVAIGFDAQELFYPQVVTAKETPIYVFNVLCGDDAADLVLQYWANKTRKALEEADKLLIPLSARRLYDACERTLAISCALVKNDGWRDEHEYRLLFVTETFGEVYERAPHKPGGQGRYVPFIWKPNSSPIRAIMPHPLADVPLIEKLLRQLPSSINISLVPSQLRPRIKASSNDLQKH